MDTKYLSECRRPDLSLVPRCIRDIRRGVDEVNTIGPRGFLSATPERRAPVQTSVLRAIAAIKMIDPDIGSALTDDPSLTGPESKARAALKILAHLFVSSISSTGPGDIIDDMEFWRDQVELIEFAAQVDPARQVTVSGTPDASGDDPPLSEHDLTILTHLANSTTLVKASSLGGLSGMPHPDTIKDSLARMERARLVERPSGPRTGYRVTHKGRAIVKGAF
jgi:hypothetical protein